MKLKQKSTNEGRYLTRNNETFTTLYKAKYETTNMRRKSFREISIDLS